MMWQPWLAVVEGAGGSPESHKRNKAAHQREGWGEGGVVVFVVMMN